MKSNVFKIFKKEIRETLRDKKSLAMMLMIPLMIPLIVIGFSAFYNASFTKEATEYNRIGFSYELSDVEQLIAQELEIDVTIETVNSLKTAYDNGELDLYIVKEGNKYIINGLDNEATSYATILAESYFESYKQYLQIEYLENNQINSEEVMNIITLDYNIVEEKNFFVGMILGLAFTFVLMAIATTASYPSTDTTAGEKERGTLETLLTFPLKSRDIIVGKFLSVSLSSIITGIISLFLALISASISGSLFEIYKDTNMNLSITGIICSMVMIIAYAILISGLCISIASKSKTFKEAQSALTPIIFVAAFPGMIATMLELKTTTAISLIPFLNVSLIFNDIVSNDVNILHIVLAFISTIILILIVFKVIVKQYKSEKVLFSD